MANKSPLALYSGQIQEMATGDSVPSASAITTQALNQTGATIPACTPVYISGANGDNPTISLASAASEATSTKTLGFTVSAIANGNIGTIQTAGLLAGFDTSSTTAGTSVWLSATAGAIQFGSAPTQPNHGVFLGKVIRVQQNNGSIYVQIQNGYEISELHDVLITSAANNNLLAYDSATSLWKNVSEINGVSVGSTTAAAGSFTTLSASSTVTLSGGTANGVLYLNGSKAATSGSALTFDGTLLTNTGSSSGATLQVLKLANSGAGANTKVQIGFFAAGTQYGQVTAGYGASTPEMNFKLPGVSPGAFIWGTSGSAEDMRLTSIGLSIGMISSVNKLAIQTTDASAWTPNSTNGTQFIFNNSALNSASATTHYQVVYGDATTGGVKVGAVASASYSADFVIANRNAGTYQENLRLTYNGNLGIGTSSPSSALDIGKSGGIVLIGTKTASASGSGLTGYRDDTGTIRYYTGILQQVANTRYSIYDNVNGAERLVVDASGNVGIGFYGFAGSPKLATMGSGDQEIQFTHSDTVSGRTVTLRLTNANSGYYTYGPYMQSILGGGLNSYTGLAFGINTLERMRISSDGTFRVKGAGTAGSTDAVQFSGSAPASSMSLDSYGNLHIPGGGGISTNEAFGTGALRNNTTGSSNTAIGKSALYSNTTGINNTASGLNALYNSGKTVTAGSFVVGIPYTIQSIGTTDFTLIGAASNTVGVVFTTTGVGTGTGTASSNTNNNSAFGYQALLSNTTGASNTASGVSALQNNTTGYSSTASGVNALCLNTTGYQNTASGVQALYSNTTGYQNTAIGKDALFYNTTGANNTSLGYSAGSNITTGANNTVIGAYASASSATVDNEITLGNSTQTMLRMPPVIKGYTSAAPTIASATTIAPTTPIVFVSGTTAIATITAPAPISSGGGQITIIPTGLFTTTTAGNIALASVAVVSKALIMTYDATTAKWYPSY